MKNLDESKSPDPYNIPVKLIKLIPYNMSGALTDIFNESFKTGIFPDLLKLAHVTPIHKGNSRLAVTNYRPISVLPIISKVFEQLSMFGSFLWMMNYRLSLQGDSTPGHGMPLAFCFWWRSSVLFGQ